ncbi:MAG TPA: DUF3047 domain-containing protein [Nitrospirota bacterium]|nr:DUF3047 domain-containing protein [Nitrospirota bacterium]
MKTWLMLFLFVLVLAPASRAQDKPVLFCEDFSSLANWKPFFFPNIKKHTVYSLEKEGEHHVLKAESHASASAIVYKDAFNVYDYPKVRWRWKVSNVYKMGSTGSKAGDDYPMRVYIMFAYDPAKAGTLEKMKFGIAKKLYGEYPPQSSLNYVWANKDQPESIVDSPYTDRSKMILLEKGARNAGVWLDEEIDIVADYQKAFGTKPPARARIAIMNDSDNTGESSVSFMEYIEVFR